MVFKTQQITAKAEDYLETILRLSETPRGARTGDIAEAIGVQPSTVSATLKSLKEQGLLEYEPYGAVVLTLEGRTLAEDVAGRHVSLRRFFSDTLGLSPAEADETACGMEHAATPLVLERMAALGEFLRSRPEVNSTWKTKRSQPKKQRTLGVETGLDVLPRGMRAVVVGIQLQGALRKRLMDLGLTPGTPISVSRAAPMGDPITVEVRGSTLSMRKADAAKIRVKWRPGIA